MITIKISDGTSASVNWYSGMNAQNALEEAYSTITFGINYYGSLLGYLVVMINGVYDNPNSGMYWEFYLNGSPARSGIDSTILNDGDSLGFNNVAYDPTLHKGSLLEIKHQSTIQNV